MYGLTRGDEADIPGQFAGQCWRCWPKIGCKCPPDETEVAQLKSERFIAEMAWIEERKRRRAAEKVIQQILDDAGSGEISLPSLIDLAVQYRNLYTIKPPNTN